MKTILLLSVLAAVSNGLAFRRNDAPTTQVLHSRQDAKSPLFSYDAWLGDKTLASAVLGWMFQDVITIPVRNERIQSQLRPGSRREKLWYGPFDLPGIDEPKPSARLPPGLGFLKMDPTSVQYNKKLLGFCKDCTVLSGKVSLYFDNDTKATVDSGVYIHHIVTLDLSKKYPPMPFYPCQEKKGFLGSLPATGFIMSGNDEAANMFTSPDGTFNAGFQLNRDANIMMQAELVNYRAEKQQVYVVVEYEWVKVEQKSQIKAADSSVSLFSVTGCTPPDYHPKERTYNLTSPPVTIPNNGFIINAKGHLHDGGDYIVLKLNGKDICTSRAVYGKSSSEAKGHSHYTSLDAASTGPKNGTEWEVITEMTQCTEPVAVRKGDSLSMQAFVDGVKHPPRPEIKDGHKMEADEMGIFFINFATSNNTAEELKLSQGSAQLVKPS